MELTEKEIGYLTEDILRALNENYVLKPEGETDQDCMARDIISAFYRFLNYRYGTGGIRFIADERMRQIKEEGWTAGHDDYHKDRELLYAAASYILDIIEPEGEHYKLWPWPLEYFKPTPEDIIRQLMKAGALVAAEIDRLQRIQDSVY